eukprot:1969312-Pyramimonas_sp.AAC.1
MRFLRPGQRFVAGSSTEDLGGCIRMRFPCPGPRFPAQSAGPPKAPMAALAYGSPTQDSVSWTHGELHRRR